MIFINFKTYKEGTGENAVSLVKSLEEVAKDIHFKVIPVVQATDIKEVVAMTTLEVWSQKIDAVEFGAHTGSILAESVFEDGAAGTFLNHSEAKFASFEELARAFDRAKEVGLKTLIFAKDLEELKSVCSLTPTYAAYEPPELIGSREASVASEKAGIISQAAEISKQSGVPLVVGAGVHSREDVKKSLELGAVGVAVATDIVKAVSPKEELIDLLKGFVA